MSAARIVFSLVWAVAALGIATATACSDGGPPGGWMRPETHPSEQADTAADGGRAESSSDKPTASDAATEDEAPDAADAALERDASAAPEEHSASDADASARANPSALAALCDGSPGITFSALALGGGQPQPGTQVMAENGYNFLIIEGNCQYWALHGLLAHVTTGTLSDAEAQGVVDAFQLEQWTLNTGSVTTAAVDGPTYYMLFGRDLNALDCTNNSAADGCESVSSPGKFQEIDTLLSSYASTRDQLSDKGKPLTGDVRYLLVRDADSLILDWQKPGAWPIGDPARVAISQQAAENYKPGQSQLARGGDAQALQEVWRQFLQGEISGHGGSLGIPVQVAGKRYALFLRDSIPLENDRGLILF